MKRAAFLVLGIPFLLLVACKTKPTTPEEPIEKPIEEPIEKPVERPKEAPPARPAQLEGPAAPLIASAAAKPGSPAAPDHPGDLAIVATKPLEDPLAKPGEKAKPVTDSDVQKARDALARARAADAQYYEAELFRGAVSDLDTALAVRTSNPDRARALLATSGEKSNRAYDGAIRKAAAELQARYAAMDAKLKAAYADKFMAAPYANAVAQWNRAASMYAAPGADIGAAKAQGYTALKAQTDLYDRLAARIAVIEALKREVGGYLDEAEKADAATWAPRELQETTRLFFLGVESFQAFKLDESEEYYGAAREAAKHATAVALQGRSMTEAEQRAESDRLMKSLMLELDAASKLTVVTEDGTVIMPEEWSGEDILKALEKLESPAPDKQSLLIPADGSTVVLSDVYEENLLDQAKELWRQGIEANAAGNYRKAIELYRESQKYVDAYKALAVKAVYTVRLIPERRDCLWRIAEYDFVYGNPYLWPKIWRRNRKLIQNPDLVYPGWLLIIPPEA